MTLELTDRELHILFVVTSIMAGFKKVKNKSIEFVEQEGIREMRQRHGAEVVPVSYEELEKLNIRIMEILNEKWNKGEFMG